MDFDGILYRMANPHTDFNYDLLAAPPLSSLLSYEAIDALYTIATDQMLNGKITKKYELIKNVVSVFGWVSFHKGTNRVVYRHSKYSDLILKIAVDSAGLKDSPDEYFNQYILKPYCTKVFEVSPRGEVGLFERVEPVVSKKVFMSIANNVFDLIYNKLVNQYIVEDIGADCFMNYGIRKGFGPVLLDFPYIYELDGSKLYCNYQLSDDSTDICGAEIDYDAGFNNLICTKCGKRYLATDLQMDIKNRKLKIKSKKGANTMRAFIVDGENNVIIASEPSSETTEEILQRNHNSKQLNAWIEFADPNEKQYRYKSKPYLPKKQDTINEMQKRVKEKTHSFIDFGDTVEYSPEPTIADAVPEKVKQNINPTKSFITFTDSDREEVSKGEIKTPEVEHDLNQITLFGNEEPAKEEVIEEEPVKEEIVKEEVIEEPVIKEEDAEEQITEEEENIYAEYGITMNDFEEPVSSEEEEQEENEEAKKWAGILGVTDDQPLMQKQTKKQKAFMTY